MWIDQKCWARFIQRNEPINGDDESVNVILVECGEERKEIVGATEKRMITLGEGLITGTINCEFCDLG